MYPFLSGISRDKTMANKIMYIPNDDTLNYPLCRLQYWLKRLTLNLIKIESSNFWGGAFFF